MEDVSVIALASSRSWFILNCNVLALTSLLSRTMKVIQYKIIDMIDGLA